MRSVPRLEHVGLRSSLCGWFQLLRQLGQLLDRRPPRSIRYAYDFVMPVGTIVTAARAGIVAEIRMKFRDGQSGEGESNWVKIRHVDNTIAAYSHLTERGALVKPGDRVEAGQAIGLSGNSGNTGGLPHLHFHLCPCDEPVDCGTLPTTFRNTDPNPDGLLTRRNYLALPLTKPGA